MCGEWLSGSLLEYASKSKLYNAPVPVHNCLKIWLFKKNNARGPSYWKLNVSILEEEDYKNQVNMLFRSTVNAYKDILDKRMLWDLFKIKLKELSSAYCKLRSKSKKTEVAIINDRFEQIEKDINSGNNTDKIKTERAELKEKIDNISKEQARSYFVRSRAEWMDKGEKYSKYFAGLENS